MMKHHSQGLSDLINTIKKIIQNQIPPVSEIKEDLHFWPQKYITVDLS